MTYTEVRKTWFEALDYLYDARSNLDEALDEKEYETDAERKELEKLLAMADKLIAIYENDSDEAED